MTDAAILRARVDALERAVAQLQSELRASRQSCRPHAPIRAGAPIALALALTMTAAVWVGAQGPRQLVVGPGGVIVTNEDGKPALTMQSLPGVGGRIAVFNPSGAAVAQLVASGGCCARLEIFHTDDEQPKVSVGVSGTMGSVRMRGESEMVSQVSALGFAVRGGGSDDPVVVIRGDGDEGGLLRLRTAAGAPMLLLNNDDGNGLIRAYGPSGIATVLGSSNGIGMLRLNSTSAQAGMLAQGDGKLAFTNTSGQGVVAVGGNSTGGYFVATNNAGKEAATISVDGDGYGRTQLWRSGELSLIAGTTHGKGDLCVNGLKGSLCMGLLGVKTMTTY